jgi:uncharacterized membrane protein YphA (DoxX/SURF4 family)
MGKFFEDKGYQAYRILQLAFVLAPIIAGLDKFVYWLDNWSEYLSPLAMSVIHQHDRIFMGIIGAIEVIVGIGVFFKPKIFAYVLSLWMLLIILVLLQTGHFYDIALRDFGLCLSAFALGKLAQKYSAAPV